MLGRRVVITGIGALSPNGNNVSEIWNNVSNGISGLSKIENFELSDTIKSKIGGEIKETSSFFQNIDKSLLRRNDIFIVYSLFASQQAVEDAGLQNLSDEVKDNIGVFIGSGIGGIKSMYANAFPVAEGKKITPFFIPGALINLAVGQVAMKYGFRGPANAFSTACATGNHSIGEAFKHIKFGTCDIILAGGSEASLCPLSIAGFDSMNALCSKYNSEPQKASRPWDSDRDGFVMSDGAATIVLEEYEHAKKRGAKIYAEITGYGLSCDANHITSPDPEGRGASKAMKMALNESKIDAEQIDYINAHGTSTLAGDETELKAVEKIFRDHARKVSISSTKSTTGHLLGAAGALEAVLSIKAIKEGIIPPTINLDNPSQYCKDWNLTPHVAVEKNINWALSNSFGFGGFNACLVFKKI